MEKAIITAYASVAQGDSSGGDHVCIICSDGFHSGCFGRDYSDMVNAPDCHQVAQGKLYSRWAELISDSASAQLQNNVTGRCHNVANRFLALAGTDVRTAGADPMIMLYYGKYGFNLPGYVDSVKSAAQQFNGENPGIVSDDDLNTVLAYINQAQQHELEILEEFFKIALVPAGLKATPDQMMQVAAIYGDFFNQRASIEGDPSSYGNKIKPIIVASLSKLRDALGLDIFSVIFTEIPPYAAQALAG